MKNTAKSGKNTLKKKTTAAKYVGGKQRTYTIKGAVGVTPQRSILSWLYAGPVTSDATTTPRGRGKKAT
jgi:hypothetical protein